MTSIEPTLDVPFGIGRLTPGRAAWAALLLSGMAVGAWCFYLQFTQGFIVTNLRTIGGGGVGWGLYIVFDVFFIGVSFAGVTVASLIRLFGLQALKPLARMAELLTITALIGGAMSVMADLGRPLEGLLLLPKFARPTSPFFGTFTMVIGGYLFASLVYFFLAGRSDAALMAKKGTRLRPLYLLWASGFKGTHEEHARHHAASFWLSLFVLPLLVTAHSTLGFIFGLQGGRPGWFSALQAPSFVVMAGVSGIGVLIVIAAVVRKVLKLESTIGVDAFRWLGGFLWVLIVVCLYFVIADELTSSYAAGGKQRHFAHALISGPYAKLFFLEIGSLVVALVILFVQFANKKTVIGWTVAAGLLVNVAAVLKRYLLVVPSQTHGMLLPHPDGHYVPSLVELGVVTGMICTAAMLFSIFMWSFPIVPLEAHPESEEPLPDDRRRFAATLFALGLGSCIAVAGFMLSNRAGTAAHHDPLLPFSPVLFIVGLMLIFGSAAVYEVLPSARPKPAPAPDPVSPAA